MAGIRITGTFVTNDPLDTYALLGDEHLSGGHRTADDIANRDAISSFRRKWGMLVSVVADNTTYQLVDQGNGDLTNNVNWIVFSGGGSGTTNKVYKWEFTGADMNTSYDNVCLHKDVLKDTSKFVVLIDGVETTNYSFFAKKQYKGYAGNYYTQYIAFNPRPANASVVEITYTENISDTNEYNPILSMSPAGYSRGRMIPITANIQNSGYFLSRVNIQDRFRANAVYSRFSDLYQHVVQKQFPNMLHVKQFPKSYDLSLDNLHLEVYGISNLPGGRSIGGSNLSGNYSYGSQPVLRMMTQTNSVDIGDTTLKMTRGVFAFRIFNSDTNTYSNWFEQKMSIKPLKVFSTDRTLSSRTYEGVMTSTRLCF